MNNTKQQFRALGALRLGKAHPIVGASTAGNGATYATVKRMQLYIETSIVNGIQWAAFEPNNELLWSQLQLTVGAFMQRLFMQGKFAGSTPQQAYFVKCDGSNNPQSSIAQGVVNIAVGFAPLYPGTFVVIQIQQMAGQSSNS
jgi:phage tail sheath protein FI